MAKKCLTKRVKKYGTGGFGADQLIQGLSGIMPVFADLSDDGKASGATIGQSIGSGLGFASNFIPGIGPIAAQAITPLLSAAGNFVGGLFDKPKKPRMKPYGYNISSGVNTGNYSFAVGGMVPAQTEVDETVYNPQTNNLDDTNAGLPHNQMGNQVTDMLSPGEYVFPSHASAPEKKRTAKQWEQVFGELGAENILGKLNLQRGKRYSAADLSELIDRKYTPREISNDMFSENTNQLMEENKQQAMQVLMMLNEMDRVGSSQMPGTMALGGFVPMYGDGGSVFDAKNRPTPVKSQALLGEYMTNKVEYYFNNAFARYVSWRIANLPKNSKIPRTSEYLNDFNKLVLENKKEIAKGAKISGIKTEGTDSQSIEIYDNIAKEYQDKLVKNFPGQGYENYPEVQAEPGLLNIRVNTDDTNMTGPVNKSQYWRNRTTMPYTHRTDVVRESQNDSATVKDDVMRGRDRTIALNTSDINYSGAGRQLMGDIFNQTLNTNTIASEVDQVITMQELGNNVNPTEEAKIGRKEAPNMVGYPAYRDFYTYDDNGTGVTVVLPITNKNTTREQAIKEYKKTGKHYGIYTDTETQSSETVATEGSMWQKVQDKMKDNPSAKPQEVVTQVKAQEVKGKEPKTFKELQEQDAEVKRIVKKVESGKPVTQEEGDYFNNEMKKAGLENTQEYKSLNQGMRNQTANAIASNSKQKDLFDYEAQSELSSKVKAVQEKQREGQKITDKERDILYQSSGTSSNDMTASGAQDRINQYNDIKYKQANGLSLTPMDQEFIGLGYMQAAEDDIATGRYITNESPTEIQDIIDKTARKEPLTPEEEEKLKNSQTVTSDVKNTAIRNNANERARLIKQKVNSGQEITQEERDFVQANSNNISILGKQELLDNIKTEPVRNPKIAKLNEKLLAGNPLTQEEINSLWESDVSEEDRRNTSKMNTNVTAESIYGKAKNNIPLSVADRQFIQQNEEAIKSYLQDFQYDDLMRASRGEKITSGEAYKKAQNEEIARQNRPNVKRLNSLPPNQLPIPEVKAPKFLPEVGLPGPIKDDAAVALPNNNPTYYDMLEQQKNIEGINKRAELNKTPTYYDMQQQGAFNIPSLWSGIPMNPNSIPQGQTIPVMPPGYDYSQGKKQTVIPQDDVMPLLPKGVIPKPDLSTFGNSPQNNTPTFYDSAGYKRGWYNKGSNPEQFKYANDKVEDPEYAWNNQTELSSSLDDKPEKFSWGDPSMWSQFAGDTMALFANMRQKAPKLKGYSDAPYRALYQQMVPNIGMYDNLTDATLSQQQNVLRGSISNPSLLAASQNQQVAQGLKAMNSAALGEKQRIDQIRQSQLSGIDQIARANVQVGNENMANKVALENAKKSAIAQYGQSVAKNMAERRNMDMQNQLYSGLYENTYPYAGQVDVSQFFPRFGRAKKNNGYGG